MGVHYMRIRTAGVCCGVHASQQQPFSRKPLQNVLNTRKRLATGGASRNTAVMGRASKRQALFVVAVVELRATVRRVVRTWRKLGKVAQLFWLVVQGRAIQP